jgi:hypothetical protein
VEINKADTVYVIPEENLLTLEQKISKLNERAHKLGAEAVGLQVIGWETFTDVHPVTEQVYQHRAAQVVVYGAAPKLAGWQFAAKIEPVDGGDNLVKLLPGITNVPAHYYTADMHCDHCQADRRRNEVFVVKKVTTDEYLQVGRNCLADFLGGNSPEKLARLAEYLVDVEKELKSGGGGGYVPHTEPILPFVTTVAALARFQGYVSKKDTEFRGGQSTGSRAWQWLHPVTNAQMAENLGLQAEGFTIEERDSELAQRAICWAQGITGYDNNFLANLRTAALRTVVDVQTIGIISAIIGAYLREVEREAIRRKEREAAKPSDYLGTVGERLLLTEVDVVGIKTFDGDYGVRTLVKLMDGAGNQITWWTGHAPDWAEQGNHVAALKATVKKHEEYKGVRGTVITRAALV